MSLLNFIGLIIFAANVLIVAATVYAVRTSLQKAGWNGSDVRRGVLLVASLLTGWLVLAVSLAWLGAYTADPHRWPTIQFGIVLPIIAGVLLYRRSDLLRGIFAAMPQTWIIGIQFYRALGFIFLVLYRASAIPAFFALPAGIGDLIVGFGALALAWSYGTSTNPPASVVALWNGFGIVDLVVAVGTGFLSSPSPLQVTAYDLPNQMITELPLVLVPTFAVPLSILLHLASLAKMRDGHESTRLATA
jgi:hypothetical protein